MVWYDFFEYLSFGPFKFVGSDILFRNVNYPISIVLPLFITAIVWFFIFLFYYVKWQIKKFRQWVPSVKDPEIFLPASAKGRKSSAKLVVKSAQPEPATAKLPDIPRTVAMKQPSERTFLQKIDRIVTGRSRPSLRIRLKELALQINKHIKDKNIDKAESLYDDFEALYLGMAWRDRHNYSKLIRHIRRKIDSIKGSGSKKVSDAEEFGSHELDKEQEAIFRKLESL